jgi:hypothetical protein
MQGPGDGRAESDGDADAAPHAIDAHVLGDEPSIAPADAIVEKLARSEDLIRFRRQNDKAPEPH